METAGNAEPRVVRAKLRKRISADAKRGVSVDDERETFKVYLCDLIIPGVDQSTGIVTMARQQRYSDRLWPAPDTVVVIFNPFEEPGLEGLRAAYWCDAEEYDKALKEAGPKL